MKKSKTIQFYKRVYDSVRRITSKSLRKPARASIPYSLVRPSVYKGCILGAQHRLFGLFALAFYIVNYVLWSVQAPQQGCSINIVSLLQLGGGLLASGLVVHRLWAGIKKEYLSFYWYFTLTYCLAFTSTFVYLCHQSSTPCLVNLSISFFLLASLVDWATFLLLAIVGTSLSYGVYALLFGLNSICAVFSTPDQTLLYVYVIAFSSVVGVLFSYNREYTQVIVRNRMLDQANQDLTRALAVKEELLNNVSHEVRTPVQAITILSRGLVDSWGSWSNEQRFEYARRVAQASQRMGALVNNLLDMSKFNAGKMVLRLECEDLKQLTDEMVEECNLLYINNKPVTLEFTVAGEAPKILLDRGLITQVLRNLLANAVKFTERGAIRINLSRTEDSYLRLSVEDEGVGIPDDEMEMIFEPFIQSTKTKSGAGGTGLGLAICRGVITEHGGKIWAEHGEKGGARFVFTIPVRQEEGK